MEKIRILVAVKTYPLPSTTHTETVCTAGLCENGRWIRLYPIAYRLLEKAQRYAKYQWIEVGVEKDSSDTRPESYKLKSSITMLHKLPTIDCWAQRKAAILQKVYMSITCLIAEARDKSVSTSLATFKPARITGFHLRKATLAERNQERKICKKHSLAETIPYTFHYSFVDLMGRRSCLQILDWEIYQLCRKLMHKYGNNKEVLYQHLRRKYFDEFVRQREVYFFLGTTKHWHIRRSRNPFVIVGVFYPPK